MALGSLPAAVTAGSPRSVTVTIDDDEAPVAESTVRAKDGAAEMIGAAIEKAAGGADWIVGGMVATIDMSLLFEVDARVTAHYAGTSSDQDVVKSMITGDTMLALTPMGDGLGHRHGGRQLLSASAAVTFDVRRVADGAARARGPTGRQALGPRQPAGGPHGTGTGGRAELATLTLSIVCKTASLGLAEAARARDKLVPPWPLLTLVVARDDDTAFGILHSRFHEVWSLRLGTWLGKGNDPRYTPTTTFETFPFPPGPDAGHPGCRLRLRPAVDGCSTGSPKARRVARPSAEAVRRVEGSKSRFPGQPALTLAATLGTVRCWSG